MKKNPNLRILVVSGASVRAQELIRLMRLMIETMPLLEELKPLPHQRDGAFRFDVGPSSSQKDPSVQAVGINSMITGAHPDLIIPDDVETSDNSLTVDRRASLLQRWSEFEVMLNPGGEIVGLGTPHSIDSNYNRLRDMGYATRRWPAEYPDPNDERACRDVSPMILEKAMSGEVAVRRGEEPGDSTFPERFPNLLLREREALMGRTGYAMQMLLSTELSDEDRYPLKLRDLIVFDAQADLAPMTIAWGRTKPVQNLPSVGLGGDRWYHPIFHDTEFRGYASSVMYVDPSGRGKDETAYAVGKQLNGNIYCLEVGGRRVGDDNETLMMLANAAKRWGIQKILVEPNYSGGAYAKLLQPVVSRVCSFPVSVEDAKWSAGQKELRILGTLEPITQQHRLVVTEEVARDNILWQQYTQLTRDRGCLAHDDRLEALAGMCRYFVEAMAQDQDLKAQQTKRREMMQEIDRFVQSCKQQMGRMVVEGDLYPHIPGSAPLRKTRPRKRWGLR